MWAVQCPTCGTGRVIVKTLAGADEALDNAMRVAAEAASENPEDHEIIITNLRHG